MPNPRLLKKEPLPDFDKYTVDFDASDRPQCFHLFWKDVEVATIRLEYDANGYLNKVIREGTRKQQYVSLKDLTSLPFFALVTKIPMIDVAKIDHQWIKGVELIDPTMEACLPISVENDAIAYDAANDRFKIDLEKISATDTLTVEAMDLDIRALVSTTDSVEVKQATAANLKATVQATDLDIRSLTTADRVETCPDSDTADIGDGTNNLVRVPIDASVRIMNQIVYPKMFNGTTWDRIRGTIAGGLLVTVKSITDALPAGSNAIGKLAANNGVDIGDVDVKSIAAGDNNIGNVDVVTLPTIAQSTKHDSKTYKTAVFDGSASNNLVPAVSEKVIKLHALTIQAQGTVVVNLKNGSGGSSLMEWSFQAREGAVIPMTNAPAYWAITSVNTALYVTLSAAVTVTITAIYSDDDTS